MLVLGAALQQVKLILAECPHSCRMPASSWSFLALSKLSTFFTFPTVVLRLLSLRRTYSNNLSPRHAPLRSLLHLVCAYSVLTASLSLKLTLQSPTAALISGQLLDPLLDPLVTLPQPNDTTHWLLVTLLPLLWLRTTMGSVLSFSAHSAKLTCFACSFSSTLW